MDSAKTRIDALYANHFTIVPAGLIDSPCREVGQRQGCFCRYRRNRPAQCANVVDVAWKEFGSLDYLVNSAIAINGGELIDLPLDKWRATIDIGLTGTFLMGQSFARRMVSARRKGAVVNLSSVSAFHPYGGSGAYSTVKAAIIHLTELMAVEWAPHGIRVNAVAPGTVETPLTAYLKDPEVRRQRSEGIPLARVGRPGDVSPAILYFLSDDADWVTASVLAVDGGVNKSLINHIPGRTWGRS